MKVFNAWSSEIYVLQKGPSSSFSLRLLLSPPLLMLSQLMAEGEGRGGRSAMRKGGIGPVTTEEPAPHRIATQCQCGVLLFALTCREEGAGKVKRDS